MPFVTIVASQGFPAEKKKQLLEQSSAAVVQSIGAPQATVRVMLHELPAENYLNAGQFGDSLLMYRVDMIEGRTDELKASLIKALSEAGFKATGVPESQIRVRVVDYPKTDMGVGGGITAKQSGR